MKKTSSLITAFLILCICLSLMLISCGKEEDYYTKSDIDSLIEELRTSLTEKNFANETALNTLKNEYAEKIGVLEKNIGENKTTIEALTATYNAKVAELEAADKANADALAELEAQYATDLEALNKADADNTAAIEALTTTYNSKVAELEAADKANADALAALKTEYETKVEELNESIAKNTAAITANKTELQGKIDELTNSHNAEVTSINNLITALQNTDASSEARIAELEAQVKELLTVQKHTVSFDLNGATATIESQSIVHGEKVLKPTDPTREGYTFLGWYVGDEQWSFIGYTVTEDVTLTAKWASTKILAVSEGYTLEENKVSATLRYPVEYIDIFNIIRIDILSTATLYKDASLIESYSFGRMAGLVEGVNRAYLVVESEYAPTSIYEILINIVKRTDFYVGDNFFATVDIGGDIIVPPETVPESPIPGYEFDFWTINGEKASFPYDFTVDASFEAVFKPVIYTVTYNVNDGIMPESFSTSFTIESGMELPVPTRSLYIFEGWYATSDFSGERIASIPVGEYGYKTLYAKWKSATNGVKVELSKDGTYYTVTGYDGSDNEVVIPEIVDGVPITKIAANSFANQQRLTSITVPDSVTSIGERAFENCVRLVKIDLGEGITSIPNYMLAACGKLTYLAISGDITSVGKYAFYYCTSLTSITLPDSVATISSYAFQNCTSLTSITIPDSVTSIGYYAFSSCTSLKSVTIPDSVTSIGDYAFSSCRSLTSVTIPDSVTSISDYAFSSCTSLTSITIPDSVTSISDYAFSYCTSLTNVTIPDSVISIGNSAFESCTSLTSVTIPDSVTNIGYFAFRDNASSFIIYSEWISKPSGWYAEGFSWKSDNYPVIWGYIGSGITDSGLEWANTEDGMIITKYSGVTTEIEIPEKINGVSVVSIIDKAFYSCTSLTSVTIPDSVTSIGSDAFRYCTSLTSVTIGDSVTSIGNSAFSDCTSLTSVTIPDSVTLIGSYAFQSCINLASVTFDNPNGWWYSSSSTATSGKSISASDLSNTSTAAKYLRSSYYSYYWKRS